MINVNRSLSAKVVVQPETPDLNPVMRTKACKHCPSTHYPPDPECVDIRAAPKDERVDTVFRCAWDQGYYCRGYCLFMGITSSDLAEKHHD